MIKLGYLAVVLMASTAHAEVNKAECSSQAARISAILMPLQSLKTALAAASHIQPFGADQAELRGAADHAEVARMASIEAITGYVEAVEDLTYQLQLCARQ